MPSSITLTVANLPISTSFFLSALQPLNYIYRGRVNNTIGFGLPDTPPDFWLSQEIPGVPAGAAHVAFPSSSREQVHEFFVTAIQAGGKCHGEPKLRDQETGYYSAAVIDFDGNSIEAVYRPDLTVDSSDESRSGSVVSSGSTKSKSKSNMSTKSHSTVSKARSPTTVSNAKAPSVVRAPSVISNASVRSSKALGKAPTVVRSVAASQAPSSVSSVRPRSIVSQAPPGHVPVAGSITTAPNGDVVTNMITEAQGAMNMARQLVDTIRPHLASANSAPNVKAVDPQSHQPSDTIVGTLLGVAAGAALHYAYSKTTNLDAVTPNSAPVSRQPSYGAPSLSGDPPEQYYYYEQQSSYDAPVYRSIEAPPSAFSVRGQKYITMEDNDEHLSDYAATLRPRRRSSFDSGTRVSNARSSHVSRARSTRMIEGGAAPPTSYRAPTFITSAESSAESKASFRSRSKSRISSLIRSSSLSSSSSRHRRRSEETLTFKPSSEFSRHSRRPPESVTLKAPSEFSHHSRQSQEAFNMKLTSEVSHRSRAAPSVTAPTTITAVRRSSSPHSTPLPPSRAATWTGAHSTTGNSAISSSPKTVVGKLKDIERAAATIEGGSTTSGKSRMTKSIVSKVRGLDQVAVTDREVGPDDSVSQISSNTGSKASRRSKR